MNRLCPECGTGVQGHTNKIYCSKSCRVIAIRRRAKTETARDGQRRRYKQWYDSRQRRRTLVCLLCGDTLKAHEEFYCAPCARIAKTNYQRNYWRSDKYRARHAEREINRRTRQLVEQFEPELQPLVAQIRAARQALWRKTNGKA